MKQEKILALETCTNICSVALWDGEHLHEQVIETERAHSKQLLPLVNAILAASHLTMSDIDAIACTRGPGAFTGVRIGVGAAKGLAFGQDQPIYAVSSLQILAYRTLQKHDSDKVFALLDARMGELYCAEYDNAAGFPQLLGSEYLASPDRLNVTQRLVTGTGAHQYADVLLEKGAILSPIRYPQASDIIALIHCARKVQSDDISPVSAAALAPVYLRDKVTD